VPLGDVPVLSWCGEVSLGGKQGQLVHPRHVLDGDSRASVLETPHSTNKTGATNDHTAGSVGARDDGKRTAGGPPRV